MLGATRSRVSALSEPAGAGAPPGSSLGVSVGADVLPCVKDPVRDKVGGGDGGGRFKRVLGNIWQRMQ